MKSSLSASKKQEPPLISAWMPEAFGDVPSASTQEIQNLIAIFSPEQVHNTHALSSSTSLIHAGESQSVDMEEWLPLEVHEIISAPLQQEWTVIQQTESEFEESTNEEEARTIIDDARSQAEALLIEAQQNAEHIRQQAEVDAQQANAEGFRQGWEQARIETAKLLEAAHKMIEELADWQKLVIEQNENSLTEIVDQIARAMFGEGVHLSESSLQIYLNEVLESARSLGDLSIYLSPDDANLLDSSWPEYQTLIRGSKVRVIPSPRIKPGGCYVQGEMGIIDARVESKLKKVLESINAPEEESVPE